MKSSKRHRFCRADQAFLDKLVHALAIWGWVLILEANYRVCTGNIDIVSTGNYVRLLPPT
jgi:hypothetical protein